jgi:hypothetical protein
VEKDKLWAGFKEPGNHTDIVLVEKFTVLYRMPATVCVCGHKDHSHALQIQHHQGLSAKCACTKFVPQS